VEVGRELLSRSEGGTVHQKIQAAELAIDRGKQIRNLPIVGDVAGKNQRIGESGGKLANVFLERSPW